MAGATFVAFGEKTTNRESATKVALFCVYKIIINY